MNGGNLTHKAQQAMAKSQKIAKERGQQQVDALHLLLALLDQPGGLINTVLEKLDVDVHQVQEKTRQSLRGVPDIVSNKSLGKLYLTQDLAQVIERSQKETNKMDDRFVSVEHLFLALLKVNTEAKDILESTDEGLNYEVVRKVLEKVRGGRNVTDRRPETKYEVIEKYSRNLTEKAEEGELDPVIGREDEIRRVMQVLSRRTKNNPVLIGEAGVGKTAIVEGLAQRIVKEDVPESLAGKDLIALDLGALVAGTRYRGEFEDRIKALLKEVREHSDQYVLFIDELHMLVGAGAAEGAVDASNLLKPALARGELRAIGVTTLQEYQENIEGDAALERRFQPVYVDEPDIDETVAILRGLKDKYEVHHGLKIKDSALVSAAKLSSRYITDRFLPDKAVDLMDEAMSSLRLELESEPAKLDKLKKQIQKKEVEKEALKKEDTSEEKLEEVNKEIADLKEEAKQFEARWKSEKELVGKIKRLKEKIDDTKKELEQINSKGDLQKVAEIKYSRIPELKKKVKKAEKKLAKFQKNDPILKEKVDRQDVAKIVSQWTGIPVTKLMQEEAEKLENMEEELKERVVGQDHALKAVSNAIRRSRSGIAEEEKPMGTFLFLGPTGVGKTETARALAEFLFNDEDAMIRLDMSEYMEKHAVSKIMGSPPGYVGHDQGGQLTEQVRRRPYSVILLDEIEKAHPEVFNILLQIFEDGRLTDSKGRTASFKNAIIIMTSNVGSEYIAKMNVGFAKDDNQSDRKQLEEQVNSSLKKEFRPEFLNRIDETIIFNYLGQEEIKEIVDLELDKVSNRLGEKEITIDVTEDAKEFLAEEGFDKNLGARPLKRVIQKEVLNPLSLKIVSGDVKEGDEIKVDQDQGSMTFNGKHLVDTKEKQEASV
ncbi:MAG: AAA family ATPase [Candidatus Paceibacterota bacterium]